MTQGVVVRTNLPDFRAALHRWGTDVERKVVRVSTVAGAAVFRGVLKKAAGMRHSPKARQPLTGHMARGAYMVRSRRESGRGREVYLAAFRERKTTGGRKPPGLIAFWLDQGWIPRRAGYKHGGKRYQRLMQRRDAGRKVEYPFVDEAFRRAYNPALDAFLRRMTREVIKLNGIR